MTRIAALITVVIGLAACETVEGVGEDVENAGEVIQDAAN